MDTAYALTAETRLRLKDPFGTLIQGSFSETMNKLAEVIKEKKPPKIVSVGDVVSKNLHEYKIIPQLAITDSKSMRVKVTPQKFQGESLVKIKNPQGSITEEAMAAVQGAFKRDKKVHIIVDGEEDLLTLIAVRYAPENSLIIYGQPRKGIVIVEATPEKKAETEKILKAMKANSN